MLADERRCGAVRGKSLALAAAAIVVLVAFFRLFSCGFVGLDDTVHIVNNPVLARLDARTLVDIWTKPYFGMYIPVTYTLWGGIAFLDRTVHPNASPGLYHALNVLLHLLNFWLVYRLLGKLRFAFWPSVAGALLFAVHPLQVESVAWISEMRGLLSGTFCLSSILCCIEAYVPQDKPSSSVDRPQYVFAVVLYGLALLSKPSAVVLPVAWIAVLAYLGRRDFKELTVPVLSPLVAGVLVSVVTTIVQPLTVDLKVPILMRPVVFADSIAFYVTKLVWPGDLAADYGMTPPVVTTSMWSYLASAGVVIVVVGLLSIRPRLIIFAAATSFIFLLPTSGLVVFDFQRFSSTADRYFYLPMLGPAIALAGLLQLRHTVAAYVCSSLLLFCFVAKDVVQCQKWKNSATFFGNIVTVNPKSKMGWSGLGWTELQERRFATAESYFRTALALEPRNRNLYINLCLAEFGSGNIDGALATIDTCIQMAPQYPTAYAMKAQILERMGRHLESEGFYTEALKLEPTSDEYRYGLSYEQAKQRKYTAARESLSKIERRSAWFGKAQTLIRSMPPPEVSSVR